MVVTAPQQQYATCVAFGDPHYITFDNRFYSFQGHCEYMLAQAGRGCNGEDFSIRVFNSVVQPSTTRAVALSVPACGNVAVELHRNGKVLLNGVPVLAFPTTVSGCLTISRSGLDTSVDVTLFDVHLLWDGTTMLRVKVPVAYQSHICGLCNGVSAGASTYAVSMSGNQFTTASGALASNISVFAASWSVPLVDSYGVPCSDETPVVDPLAAYPQGYNLSTAYCRMLDDPVGRYMNCFPVVDVRPYKQACMFDVAACESVTCGCFAVKAFEYACRDANAAFLSVVDKCGVCGGNGSSCNTVNQPVNIGDLSDLKRKVALEV